ncbi:hypothetical protein [Tenacibaculum caenipelagi]|uniref:Uncharacterized protein n=1 Tax=Tenacibaculum caenipelagi TaxID=1325435 RepID=A0A4R6TBU6_9FLAO|nr:hypothetical protein [Tenacibaculum caenipelagi]TDQ25443.1 hypothetical protein DFQ07_1864 [Tenacibaculum caenipelagi]
MNDENLNHEEHFESMYPDDIADLLVPEIKEFHAFVKENENVISLCSSPIKLLGDINYPYTCYRVSGQSNACKLTSPSDLPSEIKGIYKVDYGLTNVYAEESTLLKGVQACVYSHFGKSGTVTVSGMSSMRFNRTRPSTPTSQHNKGRAFDVKLQGRMMSNGSNYDQMACAYLCLYCVESGATKVFFSDQAVVDAVNKATGKNVCRQISGHKNHIHMDCR